MNAIPELEPHCGSWIVTSPSGAVRELYERANVEKAAAAGWRVETAGTYLARINNEAWDDYEEVGPMDLEDQLDRLLVQP